MMKIAYFSSEPPEYVCSQLRVLRPAQAAGWQVLGGVSWNKGQLQIASDTVALADAVLIQRDFAIHTDAYCQVIQAARLHGKPVIFEIDDLLTELPETHPHVAYYAERRTAILTAIAQADAVTCTTQPLAQYLRMFNPHVAVLPNRLLDDYWSLPENTQIAEPTSPIVMGYLGSPSHIPDLAMIVPVLADLLEHYGEMLILRLWGIPVPVELSTFRNVEAFDIGLVDYAAFAHYFSRQHCDLVIAPLVDHPFNRCKSALKFLEYSALGFPGVYSSLPPYADVITPGVDGFLAISLDEWRDNLRALIDNPSLRWQMGRAAQDTVRNEWLLSKSAARWDTTMRQLLEACIGQPRSAISYHLAEKFYTWNNAERARLQEFEDLKVRLANLEQENQMLRRQWLQVQETLLSPGWRLFKLLDTFRLKLAPPESRRDRALHGLVDWGFRIKRGPLAGFFRRAVPERFADMPLEEQAVFVKVQDGEGIQDALISVVIERNPLLLPLDEQAVVAWVSRQTCQDVQVVAWNSVQGQAETLTGEPRAWDAPDLQTLCQGLAGRYVCMACADLLQQSETYLETNQIALAGERLVFTLNACGSVDWPTRHVERGRLPGNRLTPFFRQVVDKNFVHANFSLDLSTCLGDDSQPVVVGKLLTHTVANPETNMAYPMDTVITGCETSLKGKYIVARKVGSELPKEGLTHTVSAVHQVLPACSQPDPRPTVIAVFPFLAVGGAEQLHLHVFEHLTDRIRFVILTTDPMDASLGTLREAFQALTPYVYQTPDFLTPQLRSSFFWRLVQRFQPVSFYIANGTSWAYDMLAELKRQKPEIRTSDQVYDSLMGWINRYDRQVVASLDACIGTNHKICQAYQDRGVPAEKVYQVEHGVDARLLNPDDYSSERIVAIRARLGLPDGHKVITFASRLHPQKRPMDVIELARRMRDNQDLVFLVIGDGPLAPVVDEQIARCGLTNVIRHGFYRPISDVLAVTDVLILPSEYEGMPLIVSEAQLMGKPVVVTDVGNNREILEATGGGVVVSQLGDVAGLMKGVQQMLQTPPAASQIRQAYLAQYGIDVIAEKYRQVLLGK